MKLDMYTAPIIGFGTVLLLLITILIFSAVSQIFGQDGIIIENTTPELKCLLFNDGKLAVIDGVSCNGNYETISWFLSKGYHIDATVPYNEAYNNKVLMSR